MSAITDSKLLVGTLWFLILVTVKEAVCGDLIDLEEHGKQFIKHLNKTVMQGRIDSWSMRPNYTYWTKNPPTKARHPIRAKIESLQCNDEIDSSRWGSSVSAKTCKEKLTWNIADGLRTPFDLVITVDAPMISKSKDRKRNVTLNLNNQTKIEEKLKSKYKQGFVNKTRRICAFYAKATFDGYFAYHFTPKLKGKFPFYALPVTRLNDSTKAFHKEQGKLTFMMKGIYEEVLCRYIRTPKPKRKAT